MKKAKPSRLLGLICKDFRPKSYFLDLGCGQGQDALFMAKNGFKVVAIDSSPEAIKNLKENILKKNIKNIKTVCCDVLNYKIEKDKYEIINCRNLLQFLPKTRAIKLIKDIQQKIKKNGFIIISSFTTNDPSARLSKKRIITHFESQEMLKLFEGFKIHHYFEGVVLDKGHKGKPKPHQHGVVRIIAQKI